MIYVCCFVFFKKGYVVSWRSNLKASFLILQATFDMICKRSC